MFLTFKFRRKKEDENLQNLLEEYNNSIKIPEIKNTSSIYSFTFSETKNRKEYKNKKIQVEVQRKEEGKMPQKEDSQKKAKEKKREKISSCEEIGNEEVVTSSRFEHYSKEKFGIPCIGVFEEQNPLKKSEKISVLIPKEDGKQIISSGDASILDETFSKFTKTLVEKQENIKDVKVFHKKLDL